MRTDFAIDKRKENGQHQSAHQQEKNDRVGDEHDVPRIPFLGEWPERAYAVVISVIEQNVAQPRKVREPEQQSPAGRQIRVVELSSAQSPD